MARRIDFGDDRGSGIIGLVGHPSKLLVGARTVAPNVSQIIQEMQIHYSIHPIPISEVYLLYKYFHFGPGGWLKLQCLKNSSLGKAHFAQRPPKKLLTLGTRVYSYNPTRPSFSGYLGFTLARPVSSRLFSADADNVQGLQGNTQCIPLHTMQFLPFQSLQACFSKDAEKGGTDNCGGSRENLYAHTVHM
jgi:hypothetical protein